MKGFQVRSVFNQNKNLASIFQAQKINRKNILKNYLFQRLIRTKDGY